MRVRTKPVQTGRGIIGSVSPVLMVYMHATDSNLVGLVNAGPYIGSALLGVWLSDPINYYLGRRGELT